MSLSPDHSQQPRQHPYDPPPDAEPDPDSPSHNPEPSDSNGNGVSDSNNNHSTSDPSPPSSSSSPPLILYRPPTLWGLLRGAAINLILPFVNGLMMGFGELLAHEAAFRLGWSGTRVFPGHRTESRRPMGPGVEIQDDPIEERRRSGEELDAYTTLE